jgi:hypothetical protein
MRAGCIRNRRPRPAMRYRPIKALSALLKISQCGNTYLCTRSGIGKTVLFLQPIDSYADLDFTVSAY